MNESVNGNRSLLIEDDSILTGGPNLEALDVKVVGVRDGGRELSG